MCSLRGPLLVLGRGCALVFGRGAEVLGRYVCSTRASSFLPFLIKFLEASLEFWFAFELVFPDLDSSFGIRSGPSEGSSTCWVLSLWGKRFCCSNSEQQLVLLGQWKCLCIPSENKE